MSNRLKILDIWVDAITRPQAIQKVDYILRYGQRPHSIFASNPEKNFYVPKDPQLYKTFKHADLLLPDGIGMVWAAKILYGVTLERIPGAEFFEDICKLSLISRYKIFIYGSSKEVNRNAAEILQIRFPGLLIGGRYHGYTSGNDIPDLLTQINESQAKILFLALGSPKQEKWFGTYQSYLNSVKIVQGIGGTLDTITGNVQRAPERWRRANAEWLYRLLKEPKRIKRQKVYPIFMLRVLKRKFFGPK